MVNQILTLSSQTNCLETYLPQSGCNATDAPCICSNATLMGQVSNCSLAACTTLEALSKFVVVHRDLGLSC